MRNEEWREFDRETRRGGLRLGGWIVVCVLFFGVLSGGVWGFRVLTSPAKGAGDSVIIKNSAENRILAQEEYVRLYNEVKRADKQLDILAETRKSSAQAETRYVGGVSYCQSAVSDYNNLSLKYRTADFIPAGHPETINDLDPATDCKENVA